MKYDIIRLEKTKNREGQDETFVQLQYLDEDTGEIIHYARWLSQIEQDQYVKDEKLLESELIPKWFPFAQAMAAQSKAAEEANRLTMGKAIIALIDAGAMTKTAPGKFTKDQIEAFEMAAKSVRDDQVDTIVRAAIR